MSASGPTVIGDAPGAPLRPKTPMAIAPPVSFLSDARPSSAPVKSLFDLEVSEKGDAAAPAPEASQKMVISAAETLGVAPAVASVEPVEGAAIAPASTHDHSSPLPASCGRWEEKRTRRQAQIEMKIILKVRSGQVRSG